MWIYEKYAYVIFSNKYNKCVKNRRTTIYMQPTMAETEITSSASSFETVPRRRRQKPRRDAYAKLSSSLITFQLPLTLNGWMFMNQKEPGEVQTFYRFTAEDLAAFTSLTDNRSELMSTCKSRDACQKLLELLALDHRYLIICDALASHEPSQFQRSLLRLLSLFSPSSKRSCADGFRRA